MSGLLFAYRAATWALEPAAPLILRLRALRGKETPARLPERLGRATLPRPQGRLAWLHGASVGETLSLLPLTEALREAEPGLSLLVTSGTVASAELLARRLPPGVIHQFAPIDGPRAVRRFLDHWGPDLAVFVESELWPNLILAAKGRRMALALVSARLSRASLDGWKSAPAAARALLSAFTLVLAQDDATAEGLKALGGRDDGRLNLKRSGAPLPVDPAALRAARDAAGARPILLAASTHPGEDETVLDAFAQVAGRAGRPILVIAPRHVARAGAVAGLAAGRGFSVTRGAFDGAASVHVVDAMGELGLWMRLARCCFLGGSLRPGPEGHNPLEPARLGVPVASGPFVANWAQVYADLAGAYLPAADADGIAGAFALCLDEPSVARAMTQRAETVAGQDGAVLERAVRQLTALIP
jgi:3-deoxy-D-manno-octulosonic-acid transferase